MRFVETAVATLPILGWLVPAVAAAGLVTWLLTPKEEQ